MARIVKDILYWGLIILIGAITKILAIPMFFLVSPLRGYARHVVHLYEFQNGTPAREFEKLKIEYKDSLWNIGASSSREDYHTGYLYNDRKISSFEYYIVLWLLWIWVDDGSYADTYDINYNKRLIKEGSIFSKQLQKDLNKAKGKYGSTYELADRRADYPLFGIISTLLWITRNGAYNYKYRFNNKRNYKGAWQIVSKTGLIMGWRELYSHSDNRWFRLEYIYFEGESTGGKAHKVKMMLDFIKSWKTNKFRRIY